MNFAKWEVGEEEYKLKLKASSTIELEKKLGCSVLDCINGIPSLEVALTIVHYAMKDWNANIKKDELYNIYDEYCENGGSLLELFSDVIMDILKVSGFLSKAHASKMEEKKQEAMKEMEEM